MSGLKALSTAILLVLLCAGILFLNRAGSKSRRPSGRSPAAENPSRHATVRPPTIVLICADDLDWNVFSTIGPGELSGDGDIPIRFPNLRTIAEAGLVFTNFNVTTPVCAPSRASLLSGQYAHRHNVRVNQPGAEISNGFPGGFGPYGRNRDVSRPLQAAGYETCFVGKYVHDGFQPDPGKKETWRQVFPDGWDHFHACLGSRYYDFWTVDSTDAVARKVPVNYRTDHEVDKVIEYLDKSSPSAAPQFVCWLPVAPHDPTEGFVSYAPRHKGLYEEEEPPSLSGKTGRSGLDLPGELATLPAELDEDQKSFIRRRWRERLAATLALDEGIGRIRNHLEKQGRLDDTLFIFTSDHGFRLGEHGHIGKRLPYDRITRVPLIVSGKGIRRGRCNELVANIDIAPTLLELAGVQPDSTAREMDGVSFARLLGENGESLHLEREGILLENWEMEGAFTGRLPSTWTSWRTRDSVYTEWATGGREYYDLANDPEQLDNRWSQLAPDIRKKLSDALRHARPTDPPPLVATVSQRWKPLSEARQNIRFRSLEMTGFAESSQGVASVQLEITDEKSGKFWNGSDWLTDPCRDDATLASPQSLITAWQYELQVPENVALSMNAGPESTIRVAVHVNGADGQTASWTSPDAIAVTTQDPETWINPPPADIQTCQPMMITGEARGIEKIDQVKLVIQDKVNGLYWDGYIWIDELIAVNCEIEPSTNASTVTWRYEFGGSSPNRVFFGARALEKKNFDVTVAWFELGPVPKNAAAAGEPK